MLGMTDLMVGQDSMLAAMEEECAARSWGPCCWRTLERAACPTAKGGEIACITTSIFVQVPPHHPLQHPLIRTLLQPPLRFAPRIHTSHSHYTFTRARLCTASCATTRTACSAAGRWECRCMTTACRCATACFACTQVPVVARNYDWRNSQTEGCVRPTYSSVQCWGH